MDMQSNNGYDKKSYLIKYNEFITNATTFTSV